MNIYMHIRFLNVNEKIGYTYFIRGFSSLKERICSFREKEHKKRMLNDELTPLTDFSQLVYLFSTK